MSKNFFEEQLSSYLMALMQKVAQEKGKDSPDYKALYYQYVRTDAEQDNMREHNSKHYEAAVCNENLGLRYIERLYKRQATIMLTSACNAHCRYCLRQNYADICVQEEDITQIIYYLAKDIYLKEVLITGGDPLLATEKLIYLMQRIINEAPNIRIIRIGTRLPVQNPKNLDKRILEFFFVNKEKVFFEIALQVNHIVELQSETQSCIDEIRKSGVTMYAQNVLLKNVNNSINALVELYDALRYQHIESHYLFHPVPIKRTAQFRMPLCEFLMFARELTASGEIPGRSKPMFSLMTDVGKCTLYEGTILGQAEEGVYEIYTGYRLHERQKWNSAYKLPASARIAENGTIIVKYLDGAKEG